MTTTHHSYLYSGDLYQVSLDAIGLPVRVTIHRSGWANETIAFSDCTLEIQHFLENKLAEEKTKKK